MESPPHPKPALRFGFDLSPQAGRGESEPPQLNYVLIRNLRLQLAGLLDDFPAVAKLAEQCFKLPAFATSHPYQQPGYKAATAAR